MKLLLCVVLVIVAVVQAQQDDAYPDDWQIDYDSFYDSLFNEDGNEDDADKTVLKDNNESGENFNDYQIEDNRSNGDKPAESDNAAESDNVGEDPVPEVGSEKSEEDLSVLPIEDPKANNEAQGENNQEAGIDDGFWGDVLRDDMEALAVPASSTENKDILEETKEILNEDNDEFDEKAAVESEVESLDVPKESEKVENADIPEEEIDVHQIIEETKKLLEETDDAFEAEKSGMEEEQSDIDQVIEETSKLLEEANDSFDANDYDEMEQEKSEEELFSENDEEFEEDTPEKVYADLNADLDKLFETLGKLSDDGDEDNGGEDTAEENNEYADNVQEYEEKYGKPYKEDAVLSWRNAEVDADPNEDDAGEDLAENDENNMDDYEAIDDSNLGEIFGKHAASSNEKTETEQKTIKADENNKQSNENASNDEKDAAGEEEDEMRDLFAYMHNYDDGEPNPDDDIDSVIKQIFPEEPKEPQSYGNDGLVDEKQPKNEDAKEFESMEASNNKKVEENIEVNNKPQEKVEQTTKSQQTIMVDDLSSAELDDLMKQFAIAHADELDVNSEIFAKNIAPIHVTLSVDEPTVITSPNYPSPYPTNNIVDWIFEGPGMGIEMNITNFAVNGAIGDYLLVKPGGLDASGQDGLIFTHRLHSERRYRFTDVNRMFVRFEAKPGWSFLNGFSFSVKMIWPLPQSADELPEAEPVIKPPAQTLTLSLAGLTLAEFSEVKGDFVGLIADMAAAYIKDNNIDRGLNTTYEVTQITRASVCNIHWPNHETCVQITFGVPLQYEDEEAEPKLTAEDLDTMWNDYIVKEEFASRLISLGVTEYAVPNDKSVVMVWLVIAGGVVLSMVMLAFALWRFSCFEDYTRMKAYSDTDSIHNEKRNLDLYPTPHQTLPPLYTENDYKWADDKYDDSTRVDMGGFSNKSYARDELFGLDSDEDVITTRDRKGVISPRDIYEV